MGYCPGRATVRAAFGVALEPGAPGFRSVIPVRKQSCTWVGGVLTLPHPHPQASSLCSAESRGWGGGEEGRGGAHFYCVLSPDLLCIKH